ncbi:hypothetical protein ACFW3Z_18505 [Nocardiopsis alba]|jgi:predicted O-methyltransferase YrrM|uniref:hypothetical protein n=1 Tax=Nocardiopsis alba TaxID=53437 RepID=UPI0033BB9484
MSEAGANPIEAMQGGEYAETLAAAMAGLADAFDILMGDAANASVHEDVKAGLQKFRDEADQSLIDLQQHGLALANNIQAGAGETAQNDLESSDGFHPWEAHRDINFD